MMPPDIFRVHTMSSPGSTMPVTKGDPAGLPDPDIAELQHILWHDRILRQDYTRMFHLMNSVSDSFVEQQDPSFVEHSVPRFSALVGSKAFAFLYAAIAS